MKRQKKIIEEERFKFYGHKFVSNRSDKLHCSFKLERIFTETNGFFYS